MNAPVSEALCPDRTGWHEVHAAVNAWRGCCMHHFAQVEHAVTESLLALHHALPGQIGLRHLIGQRFEDLAAAVAEGGPLPHLQTREALARYRAAHEGFRTLLCHGQFGVSIEISGRWLLVVDSLSIKSRQAVRTTEVIREGEAEQRLAELKRDGQRLTCALGQLRRDRLAG
jgi:hypothetical protein